MIKDTLSPKPLFDWFARDKNNRAKLRQLGYTDGRISNWKRRGVPRAEVGNLAQIMGTTYEAYVLSAEVAERRERNWKRAASIACAALIPVLASIPDPASASPSAKTASDVYYVKRQKTRRRAAFLDSIQAV